MCGELETHKDLWRAACGAPQAPPPAPLVRAGMHWDTDADIDLYTWDAFGNLLYFGDREGIPGAELIEDVIPSTGESVHRAEFFRETTLFNRAFTFGICDYRGIGGEVTLVVADPGGAIRIFHETLFGVGEGVVITTSPAGIGYEPEPGWCRDIEDE